MDISVRSNTSVRLLCTFTGHLCPIKHLCPIAVYCYWTSLSDQTPLSGCCGTFMGHLSDQTPLSDCCVLLLDISVRSNTSVRLLWHFYGTSVRSNTSVRLLCTVIGHLCPIKRLCPVAVYCYRTSVRSNTSVRLLLTFTGHLCPIKHFCPVAVALLWDICPIKHLCPIAVYCYWTSVRSNASRLLCTFICSMRFWSGISFCPFAVRFCRTLSVRLQSGFDRTSLSVCCGLLVEHLRKCKHLQAG